MKKKRFFKVLAMFVLLLIVGIQLIPPHKNNNPEISANDFIQSYKPPVEVAFILKASCYDCHSNNTQYPWYSYIQPIRHFMDQHIQEGKVELNFSKFAQYSNRMKRRKFQSIVNELKNRTMPIESYQRINEHAELSDEQRTLLIDWFESLSNQQ